MTEEQAVSKWEISSYPDPQLLPAVAECLGVTIDELFGRATEKEMSMAERAMKEIYDMKQDGSYTLYLRDEGFIFGRLNANLPYMLVMPEPEKG